MLITGELPLFHGKPKKEVGNRMGVKNSVLWKAALATKLEPSVTNKAYGLRIKRVHRNYIPKMGDPFGNVKSQPKI